MEILKAFKFRLYPTEEQKAELREPFGCQFGHARFVYNASLELRKEHFFMSGESLNYEGTTLALTEFKNSNPDLEWLGQADSQVLQQSLKDLDKAFQNFFRNHKNGTLPPPGKKPRKDGMPNGYPTPRRKFDKQSIRYPQRFKFEGSKLYLPKVGWARVRRHRRIEGQMKNCTVSKTKTGRYFVSIQCELDIDIQPTANQATVGIDLGLKDFAILSSEDGTIKIAPPKHLRKAENLIKIRQRRFARTVKGSNGRNKARLRVSATHEKVTNRRKDFHHKLSREIVNAFGAIGLETLNVKGMIKNHNLAKSISDAGWSQFVAFIEYKAAWAGAEVVRHDQWFASAKTCNDCAHINRDLKLKDREWVCPSCGVIHDRDENAAKNLRPKSTAGVAGTRPIIGVNAVGDVREPQSNDTSVLVKTSAPEKFKAVQLLTSA